MTLRRLLLGPLRLGRPAPHDQPQAGAKDEESEGEGRRRQGAAPAGRQGPRGGAGGESQRRAQERTAKGCEEAGGESHQLALLPYAGGLRGLGRGYIVSMAACQARRRTT